MLYFFLGILATLWFEAGLVFWRKATIVASGPRGLILNPTDDISSPAVWFAICVWGVAWPILVGIMIVQIFLDNRRLDREEKKYFGQQGTE